MAMVVHGFKDRALPGDQGAGKGKAAGELCVVAHDPMPSECQSVFLSPCDTVPSVEFASSVRP